MTLLIYQCGICAKSMREFACSVGAKLAQWVKCWLANLVILVQIPATGDRIF